MKKLILTMLVLLGSVAQANQDATTSAMEFAKEEAEKKPEGLLPFIAIGGGYTGSDLLGKAEGSPSTIKLLGSYYFTSPYVIDLAYGVNNQQFSQVTGTNLDTSKTGGVLEFAARYRWESRWQAGIIADQFYEQGKNLGADQGDAHFVGLQALREFNMSTSWLGRVGVRAMALTNNASASNGTVAMYLIDLQFGWNPGAYKPTVRQTSQVNPRQQQEETSQQRLPAPSRPVAEARPEPILRDVSYAGLMAGGEGSFVQFKPAQFAVTGQDEQKISRLAQALNDNRDLYQRVEIHGYTDPSGSAAKNQELSQKRANEVKALLQKHGLQNVDVVAIGEGSTDSTGIKSQDRRAELVFVGVRDEDKLRDAISTVK
ncbi:MAG: OmpA family protein [Pseudobdellovibrionaceae bacterium]